jgi:hypothetical protein
MALGAASGLAAYFLIGFFTAALVGAAVSMVVTVLGSWIFPQSFQWDELRALRRPEEAL